MMPLHRRAVLASLTAAAGGLLAPAAIDALATAAAARNPAPAFYRFEVGGFELTAIYDGVWHRRIDETFVSNAPFAEVQKALTDAFMPADTLSIPFTPLVVDTGSKLALIDTGSGGQIAPTAGSLGANFAAANIDPKDIDVIVISNFHPDHINGIKTKDNEIVFPNVEIRVPEAEWSYWMDGANLNASPPNFIRGYFLNARRIFRDLGARVTLFAPGIEVAPGITAIAAPGHTPGHCAFAIASGEQSLLALCDTTNNPYLFARHPEWMPVIDHDGPLAVTRESACSTARPPSAYW
jgi:glyoxylase-like metal-dependent hydrolase (beta-lactamase superfamily II)